MGTVIKRATTNAGPKNRKVSVILGPGQRANWSRTLSLRDALSSEKTASSLTDLPTEKLRAPWSPGPVGAFPPPTPTHIGPAVTWCHAPRAAPRHVRTVRASSTTLCVLPRFVLRTLTDMWYPRTGAARALEDYISEEIPFTDETWARIDAMSQVQTDTTIEGASLVLCDCGPVN